MVRRVAVISSASGNGKTTLGRQLARTLGVTFVELDALVHGAGWVEMPDDVLRARVQPILAREGWVIDGTYRRCARIYATARVAARAARPSGGEAADTRRGEPFAARGDRRTALIQARAAAEPELAPSPRCGIPQLWVGLG